ncbi:MAG TPA: OmpH family outer membrane protein [Cyclobacteriaceae bacterium]|nr:OmpH family outer membrane protein [Cyclobacteriaceae bacterium]
MKNLSLILNFILIVAVGILYFLHFRGHGISGSLTSEGTSPGITDVAIAYVIEDSLLNNYDLFKELSAQLEKKQADLEKTYTSRAQSLQTEIENFRSTSGNMTINQARAVEEDLMRKQQNLYQYQETLGQQMLEEQAKVNDQLFQRVAEFLKKYSVENGYNVVLNYKRGTGMLFGSEMLDITKPVTDRLNAEYKAEKEAAASGKTTKADSAKAGK